MPFYSRRHKPRYRGARQEEHPGPNRGHQRRGGERRGGGVEPRLCTPDVTEKGLVFESACFFCCFRSSRNQPLSTRISREVERRLENLFTPSCPIGHSFLSLSSSTRPATIIRNAPSMFRWGLHKSTKIYSSMSMSTLASCDKMAVSSNSASLLALF